MTMLTFSPWKPEHRGSALRDATVDRGGEHE
jgi:hypothetical protein